MDDTMEQVFHKNHIQPEVLSSLFSVSGFRPFRETLFAAVAPETRFGTWRNNQYLALFTSYDPAFVERARLANQASYLLREGDVEVFCKTFTEDNLSNALLAITPRVDMNQSQQILRSAIRNLTQLANFKIRNYSENKEEVFMPILKFAVDALRLAGHGEAVGKTALVCTEYMHALVCSRMCTAEELAEHWGAVRVRLGTDWIGVF